MIGATSLLNVGILAGRTLAAASARASALVANRTIAIQTIVFPIESPIFFLQPKNVRVIRVAGPAFRYQSSEIEHPTGRVLAGDASRPASVASIASRNSCVVACG